MFEIFSELPIQILDWTQQTLLQVPYAWVLVIAFVATFIENIVPPSPSDAVVLFIGTMIVFKDIGFTELLIICTLGSTIGFVTMYIIGKNTGDAIIDGKRFKFINRDSLEKPTEWFQKYGYGIIIANRFLAGTRAVISFFAGVTRLNLKKTTALSAISAAIWNAILLYLGIKFADNIDTIKEYIALYGKIVFPIALVLLGALIIRSYFGKKK
jgi:membrane protein DedA with SNARE-associated domain